MPYKSLVITNAATVYQQPAKTSQFYVGFSSVDISNTNSKLYDLDLIMQDILNQFNTRKGERVMNPAFGSIVWDVIMEPMTDDIFQLLSNDIKTICTSDPRAYPIKMNVNEQPGGYLIEITMVLTGTNQSQSMILNFNQSTGLTARTVQ